MALPKKIDAPASADYATRKQAARAVALKAKGAGRTPAETKELIDTLEALVPPGILDT